MRRATVKATAQKEVYHRLSEDAYAKAIGDFITLGIKQNDIMLSEKQKECIRTLLADEHFALATLAQLTPILEKLRYIRRAAEEAGVP